MAGYLVRWFLVALAALAFVSPVAAQHGPPSLALALERTEHIRAVRDLQISFAARVEAGDWSGAAKLFTEDGAAIWDGVQTRGRESIGAALRQRLGAGRDGRASGSLHAVLELSPVLTLSPDGRSAQGRWHEIGMFGGPGVEANWTGGIYENRYVLTDAGWRIDRLDYHSQFSGDYASGWFDSAPDLLPVPYHYVAETVGAPVTVTSSPSMVAPAIAPADLAARAQRLADEDAVRNLQHIFGFYADRRMWDDATDLFAPNASYSSSDAGTFVEPQGIRAMLEREGPAGLRYGDLNDHVIANLVVCIAPDGASARVRGLEFGMSGNNGGQAFWSLTSFDNRFAKSGGVWRIAEVRRFPTMRTTHDVSWDGGVQPLPPPSRPPDGPAAPRPPELNACQPPLPSTAAFAPAQARRQIESAAAAIAIDSASNALGNYIDDFEWESLGKMLTRDGLREAPGIGFYKGPERVYGMQSSRYGPRPSPRTFIPVHQRTQPVIHVSADGTHAKIRTRLLQFNSTARGSDRQGSMGAAIYEDEARLEDGVWRFSYVEIDHYLQTRRYSDAWTKVPPGFGAPAAGQADKVRRDNPPDAPLVGEIFPPYPAIGLMWFHYPNPVSGRAPEHMTPKTEAFASGREAAPKSAE